MTDDELPGPPHDAAAERAVLGACLVSAEAYRRAAELVSNEDWYIPAHAALWNLIREVAATSGAVDPITVNGALIGADPHTRRLVDAPMIATIYGGIGNAYNVAHYAQLIAAAGLRRRLLSAAQSIAQRAMEAEDALEAAEWAVTEVSLARDTMTTADPTDVDVHDLIGESTVDDWVLPGLLARGDRFILTASEGLGKSTLLRQIAVCSAAGIHPFQHCPVDPIKVLVVDCENGRKLSRDRYAPLVAQAKLLGASVEDRLRIDVRPSGLNLMSSPDAALLLRMVDRVKPDLMLIGPIYRLHEDDPNDEKAARKIAAVLDRARGTGCAIVTEAHTPHTDGPGGHMLRPFGSSLWKRWPEFGYCLKLTADSDYNARMCKLIPWRGPRDERDWPVGLAAGGTWPWEPVRPDVMRASEPKKRYGGAA